MIKKKENDLTIVINDFILLGSLLSRMRARQPVINSARTTPNAKTSLLVVIWSSRTDLWDWYLMSFFENNLIH